MSALKLLITIYYLLSLYSPTGGQFTGTASLAPPSSVQPTNPNNHGKRYNIIAGSSFTISCNVQHPGNLFNADLYKDDYNDLITDRTLVNTTYTKTGTNGVSSQINIELTFNNFQAVHNGRYECYANTTDGTESRRISHALYGTGAVTVTPVTPRYQVYDSNEDIYVEVQIRGEFYDIIWRYDASDPTGASGSTLTINSGGVSGAVFRQGLRIATTSSSHQAGYYVPSIQDTQASVRPERANESTLYRTYASPSASLPTLGSQSPDSDLTVTCTATGYPEVTISFTTTDISASNETGDPITTVTATPSAPFTTTRSITFYSITLSDCGSVTCTASNSDGTTTSTSSDTQSVEVTGPPTVSISPMEEQVVGIGDNVTLTCSASDCVSSSFSFVWYRDGSNVSTSGVLTISNVTGSDFGEYTCNVTGEGGTGSATTYISEESLTAPNVTVTALPESISVGEDGVLICEATGGQPATYTFTWTNASDHTLTGGITTSGGQSNLTITDAGDEDYGMYTCTVSSSYWNATGTGNITELVSESATSIQLYLSPVSNCLTWTDANGDSKLSNISESVRSVMTACSKCNITYTAGPFFSCLGTDSDQTVVFWAQIVHQYIRDSPTNPLSLLQSWVSSGPLLTVFQQQLGVNSACQFERSLDIVPQCTPDPSMSPSISPPSSTSSPPPISPLPTTTIVVTVCVLFVLSIFLAAMVIVLILCIRRWMRNRKAIPVKEEHEYMDTVRGGLTGGMVYSNVGDPIQMDKNPAYESTQVEEGDTEGEYAYIPTGVQEESTNL